MNSPTPHSGVGRIDDQGGRGRSQAAEAVTRGRQRRHPSATQPTLYSRQQMPVVDKIVKPFPTSSFVKLSTFLCPQALSPVYYSRRIPFKAYPRLLSFHHHLVLITYHYRQHWRVLWVCRLLFWMSMAAHGLLSCRSSHTRSERQTGL